MLGISGETPDSTVTFCGSLAASRCCSQEHLNTQCAELSDYFANRCGRVRLARLNGEQFRFQVLGRRALQWQRLLQQQCRRTAHLQVQSFGWSCDGVAPRLRLASLREARQGEQQHLLNEKRPLHGSNPLSCDVICICAGFGTSETQAKKWSCCTTTPTSCPSATSGTWSRRPRSSSPP